MNIIEIMLILWKDLDNGWKYGYLLLNSEQLPVILNYPASQATKLATKKHNKYIIFF